MHTLNDPARFLQAIFPNYLTSAIFANLEPSVHTRDYTALDTGRDCYWSIAAFPDDGVAVRNKARALEVRALVVDDVGTKVSIFAVDMGLGVPTAIIESSPGNFQYVYKLAEPVTVEQFYMLFDAAQDRVKEKFDPATRDAVHLFRLPMGINTKGPDANGKMSLGCGGTFKVRLAQLNPAIELRMAVPAAPAAEAAGLVPGHGNVSLSLLRELMKLIPNDEALDRGLWAGIIGHGLKALCRDDEEGFTVFDEWSQTWPGDGKNSYDYDKTRKAWVSFGASGGLTTKGGKLRALAESKNPEGFRTWDAKLAFDLEPDDPFPDQGVRTGITATPFKWMDLAKTEPRDWLYGDILLRKFISMTVAPGGVGKSSLVAVETLAQVSGKPLLGEELHSGALRVWLWNLEDPYTETQKKILAAAKHYNISEEAIGDRLFVDSGRDQRLVIAVMDRSGPMIVKPVVDDLVSQILLRGIDVVVVDPFVSCHGVPENDNTAQDMVVKEWGRVAELGRCAVHLVDHTSKAGSKDVVTDSSRGAKAKTDAARVVRVVNRMSDVDGRAYGITETMRWKYFNTFNDKANMAPPKARRDWFMMESVWAGNGASAGEVFSVGAAAVPMHGDSVGVAVQWTPPSATILAGGNSFMAMKAAMGTKEWRKHPHAQEKWIGHAAAKALELDVGSVADRATLKGVLAQWFRDGLLIEVTQPDAHRKDRKFIKIAGGF